ncbi:MAG: TIR domain-containing protein [Dehalococcoidia bacterium]
MSKRLAAQGHLGVFLDFDPEDGIPAGRDWEQELYRQVRACRAMVVLCSHASLASKWCFAEITYARALDKYLFPVRLDDCQVDKVITDRIQIIDLVAEPEAGYGRLWDGLKDAGLDPKDSFDWDGSRPPYPGLFSFEEADAAVYFGRDDEIEDGLDRLNAVRRLETSGWAMVLGASGSGKSSLVRAGLVPRLKKDPQRWLVTAPFRPRDDVARELALVLSAAFTTAGQPRDPKDLRQAILASLEPGAANALRELAHELRSLSRSSEARVLLIVDQFEELLGPDAEARAGPFLGLLRRAAAGADSPIVVLGTMRSDYLGTFQGHHELLDLRFEALSLGPMSREDIIEVIQGPAAAELGGLTFEQGLVEEIAADASLGDALPLLAFALRQLYDRFGRDHEIGQDDYRTGLGGLEGALRKQAEDCLEAMNLDADAALELQLKKAMLKMVRLDNDGRRRRQIARWSDLPEAAHALLQQLVDARLLVASVPGAEPGAASPPPASEAGGRTVEVAHEALFRSWDRLERWISDSAEELALRTDLQRDARGWEQLNRPAGELWKGPRLDRARATFTAASGLDDGCQAFLAASIARDDEEKADQRRLAREKERRRQRLFMAAVAAATVFAGLGAVALLFFFDSRNSADDARSARDVAVRSAEAAVAARDAAEKSGQAAREAEARANEAKDKALFSLFADLELNIGLQLNAGSLCLNEGPACVYGRPIPGAERPAGLPPPLLLGSLDSESTRVMGPPGARPSSLAFVAASEYGDGHVIAYAHDGLIVDVEFRNCSQDPRTAEFAACKARLAPALQADNLVFADNALRWVLSSFTCDGSSITIAIFEEFESLANTRELAAMLNRRGWDYKRLDPSRPLADQLECVDALIWGNVWEATDQQLFEVVQYVRDGGGLLLGGLGWSWVQAGPGSPSAPPSLETYPANRLAAAFGFAFSTDAFEAGASVRILAPEAPP